MGEVAIDVQNISKLYKLGTVNTGSIRQELHYWWKKRILKKDDPFFSLQHEKQADAYNSLWALKGVSFELKKGEVLGIIGSNGSGKSTLLKIISRIVRPTEGSVRGKGKISSILEVGTGFHHELTGRENIYSSGFTLGMSKEEIKRKFDEIVQFSGVEAFLDTPVKRYSSGMYVRLAFAVAAHLEPDILIIDEVLAVGDADFQKKCLGKMQDVSNKDGRTILFVSHNLPAIANLCDNVLWLDNGKIRKIGEASSTVNAYIRSFKEDKIEHNWDSPRHAPGNDFIRLKSVQVVPSPNPPGSFITVRTPIQMDFEFWCFIDNCELNVNVILLTHFGECVFNMGSPNTTGEKAVLALRSIIPGNLLNNMKYAVSLTVIKDYNTHICEFSNCISFEVEDQREDMGYYGSWPGIIRPHIESSFSVKQPKEPVQSGAYIQ